MKKGSRSLMLKPLCNQMGCSTSKKIFIFRREISRLSTAFIVIYHDYGCSLMGTLHLEFYLVTVPDGKLSPRLAALKPGDEVQVVSEAAGFFVLDEVPHCETLWMLATGTAIGPYLSILQLGKDLDRFKNLVLVHAARYAADLSYLPLMQELEKRYEGKLRIQTVVSRETAAGSLTGRIPALIESGELESTIGLPMNKETSHVMLCGNPQMVRDTQQLLKETRQMTKHLRRRPGHMTAEHYW